MAHVNADRVQETTTTTGTGTLTLAGAVAGFRTFTSAVGNGNTCYYAIEAVDTDGVPTGAWEVGLGTVGAGTLARTSVLFSSNSNNAVSFAAGTKRVFAVLPATLIALFARTDQVNTFADGPQVFARGVDVRQGVGQASDTVFGVKDSGGTVRLLFDLAGYSFQVGTAGAGVNLSGTLGNITVAGAGDVRAAGFDPYTVTNPTVRWGGASPHTSLYSPGSNVVAVGAGGTSGGGVLEFGQVASGGSPSSNSARVYAKDVAGTAEIFVKDEAGTETQISPHATDAPAHFYDLADEFPYVTKEVNPYTGRVRYINHSRQARAMQALFNGTRTLAQIQAMPADDRRVVLVETFADHNGRLGLSGAAALTQRSWAADQVTKQSAYDAARAAELAAHAAWLLLPPDGRGNEPPVRPARDVRKPVPPWLAARGVT